MDQEYQQGFTDAGQVKIESKTPKEMMLNIKIARAIGNAYWTGYADRMTEIYFERWGEHGKRFDGKVPEVDGAASQ
ncbi:MAG: hypothetical protein ABFC57_12705 [Veillonellales bacterium]